MIQTTTKPVIWKRIPPMMLVIALARYCSSDRIEALASVPSKDSLCTSTSLDHGAMQRTAPHPPNYTHQYHRPEDLQRQRSRDSASGRNTDIDRYRHIHNALERQELNELSQQVRHEPERHQRTGRKP